MKKIKREMRTQDLVNHLLRNVCSALAAPCSPEEARLRAFVFKKQNDSLVCSHFWAPRPVKEVVGALMFGINSETEKQVAVVRAAMLRRTFGSPISVLTADADVEGEVEKDLCFVLAAPILGPAGEVWGTVDFDASSKEGEEILRQEGSQNILFELGQILYLILTH